MGFFWRDFPFLQEVAKSKLNSCFVGKRRKTSVLGPLAQGPEGDAYSCRKGRPVLSLYIYLLFHIPSLAQGGKAELRDRMWA
jgi:hypothetical protein